jgi:acetolactate synthase-1/2/3 large subunit
MAGRSTVPHDHPQFVYGFGKGADQARREADVVLVVGSRLGNLDLPFDKYWGGPGRQRIIQVDLDPRDLGFPRPIALGIVADVRPTLEALGHALAARGVTPRTGDYLPRCREADRAWREQQLAAVRDWSGPGIHPAHVVEAIGRAFGGEAVYVADGGMTSLWAHWFAPSTRPRSYHSILELGMLGTGIPSAIGAKLAAPDRDVVCLTGDGAAGFNFMEMQSAAREGLELTTVVFAEGAWTMEEPSELMQYGRTFGTEMGEVRWDKVAEGLGCQGLYVEKTGDLDATLAEAKQHPGPSVVCVRTDRDANRNVPADGMMRFVEVYQGPLG